MKLRAQPEMSLGTIVDGWRHRTIAPNPEYQRGRSWKQNQQQLLVDSALRGYPLPRFYFSLEEARDPFGKPVKSLQIIDGLQRILAFADYLDDKWPLLDPTAACGQFPRAIADAPCPWADRRFSELSPELQAALVELQLPVVIIESFDSPEQLRDLFIRLQAGTALTRQQVRDAWPGAMSEYVERIGGKLDRRGRFAFLSNLDRRGSWRDDVDELEDPFHDGRQTAAQLLRLFLDRQRGWALYGVDARALDDLYHSETAFEAAGPAARAFERVLKNTEAVVADEAPYTTAGTRTKVSKVRLFALFLTLAELTGAPDTRLEREIAKIARAFWTAEWSTALGGARAAKATSRSSIAHHYGWFRDTVIKHAGLTFLDPRRAFSDHDKDLILAASGGACTICQRPLTTDDLEFDHIVPWIQGGPTNVSNGRAVHRSCNRRRGEGTPEVAADMGLGDATSRISPYPRPERLKGEGTVAATTVAVDV